MVRIIIVDDQKVVSQSLAVVLGAEPAIQVVGVAYNGLQALELVGQARPDVVLMDLNMPLMNGVQATREIRARYPDTAVLILTTYDDDDWVLDAVRAGASGYLLKDIESDALVAAVVGVSAGETAIAPSVGGRLMSFVRENVPATSDFHHDLTERELSVLRLLASGLTNSAIADTLHLAEGTVRNYVSTVFSKLGVDDRAQATALAWRTGLVRPDVS